MKEFVIQGGYDEDEDETLYWNNIDGWGDFESATVFSTDELNNISFPITSDYVCIAILNSKRDIVNNLTIEEAYAKYFPDSQNA